MSEALKEISIILDVWDDIFSDFDPRPLGERALSEDFINELKKRYRETAKGDLLISFFAPETLRDAQSEEMVIQRLRRYFRERALQKRRDIQRMRKRGAIFVAIGALFLSAVTVVTHYRVASDFALKLLEIPCVPLGWFGIWEGLSKIVEATPTHAQEEALYRKLADAEYEFHYGA